MGFRPKIPPAVKFRLWTVAGGRCQFKGCNDYLLVDALTLTHGAFGDMAHIIGASARGPPGDRVKSNQLAKSIDNLMLLCDKHHDIVDNLEPQKYPPDVLQQYKRDHEDRIQFLTGIKEDAKTHVLTLTARVHGQPTVISHNDTALAVLPRFPYDKQGHTIDLSAHVDFSSGGWELARKTICYAVERAVSPRPDGSTPQHLSVFALGPIPLLIALGRAIGDKVPVDLYQRHRKSETWTWPLETAVPGDYSMSHPPIAPTNEVRLLLSVSGDVPEAETHDVTDPTIPTWTLRANHPSIFFLTSRSQVEAFKVHIRQTLTSIYTAYGRDVVINLFPAVPAPLAVEIGRSIMGGVTPVLRVFDRISQGSTKVWIRTLDF